MSLELLFWRVQKLFSFETKIRIETFQIPVFLPNLFIGIENAISKEVCQNLIKNGTFDEIVEISFQHILSTPKYQNELAILSHSGSPAIVIPNDGPSVYRNVGPN